MFGRRKFNANTELIATTIEGLEAQIKELGHKIDRYDGFTATAAATCAAAITTNHPIAAFLSGGVAVVLSGEANDLRSASTAARTALAMKSTLG